MTAANVLQSGEKKLCLGQFLKDKVLSSFHLCPPLEPAPQPSAERFGWGSKLLVHKEHQIHYPSLSLPCFPRQICSVLQFSVKSKIQKTRLILRPRPDGSSRLIPRCGSCQPLEEYLHGKALQWVRIFQETEWASDEEHCCVLQEAPLL